jgi:hypothetical protein
MGIKTGHDSSYTLDNLTLVNLLTLITHRQLQRKSGIQKPVIDIDASWVVRCSTNITYDMRVISLMRLVVLFILKGCHVNIIFDGNTRHHTKRSTIKRKVDCHRTKVDYHVLKHDLSQMYTDLNNITCKEEKQKMTKNIAQIKKKLKSMDKMLSESIVDVGDALVEKVKQHIDKIEIDFGSNITDSLTYMIAEFQADSVIV